MHCMDCHTAGQREVATGICAQSCCPQDETVIRTSGRPGDGGQGTAARPVP
jgi:hypothetical protein